MKKVLSILLVVILVGIVAWAWRYRSGACDYRYEVVSRYDEPCKDSSDCTSYYVSYPVFSKKLFPSAGVDSINAQVFRQVSGPDGKTPEQLADEFFQEYRKYVAFREEIAVEEQDTAMMRFIPTWFSTAECFVVVDAPRLIVTGYKVNQYAGGAHGMYALAYTNYDVLTGRRLGLSEVFSDTLALAEKITARFIRERELDTEVPLSEQGYFIEDNLLPLTDNFALHPDGVIFYYNVYEIAPYSYGPSSVTVPYADLDGILKYKPDFKRAEVFAPDMES